LRGVTFFSPTQVRLYPFFRSLMAEKQWGMWRRVTLVRTYVSEECITSIIMVERITELGTALALTSNWSTRRTIGGSLHSLRRENLKSYTQWKGSFRFVLFVVPFYLQSEPIVRQFGILIILQPYRPPRPITGIALLLLYSQQMVQQFMQWHVEEGSVVPSVTARH
jgi:hypothetical protein